MTAPRFGLLVPSDLADPGALRELALEVERRGFQSLWVCDYSFHFPSSVADAGVDPFAVAESIATWTAVIRVGVLVQCGDAYRAATTAKMTAALDVQSGGRVEFGCGAGATGPADRVSRMDEALTILRQAWIDEFIPLQQPHPPITIGGGGEGLLGVVARHADYWNYLPVPLPLYERKAALLTEHCQRLGRDPDSIARSLLVPTFTADWEKEVRDQLEGARRRGTFWVGTNHFVQGTPDIVVPRFRDYARRGVSLFILVLPDPNNVRHLEFVEREIIRELT